MAATALTAQFDATKPDESIKRMLHEWMSREACFGSGDSASVDIVIEPGKLKSSLVKPEIFMKVTGPQPQLLGAGGFHRTGGVKGLFMVEIRVRTSRSQDDAYPTLVRTGDKLWAHWRSKTNGRPVLGISGLRKSMLRGPTQEKIDGYYQLNYLLTFEVAI